jgi:hypothetical protein
MVRVVVAYATRAFVVPASDLCPLAPRPARCRARELGPFLSWSLCAPPSVSCVATRCAHAGAFHLQAAAPSLAGGSVAVYVYVRI